MRAPFFGVPKEAKCLRHTLYLLLCEMVIYSILIGESRLLVIAESEFDDHNQLLCALARDVDRHAPLVNNTGCASKSALTEGYVCQ